MTLMMPTYFCRSGIFRLCRRSIRGIFPAVILINAVIVLLVMTNQGFVSDHFDPEYIYDTEEDSTLSCQNIHLAVICSNPAQTHDVALMLKTLFFYRTHYITLHLITESHSNYILRELMNTWKIPAVNVHFYDLHKHQMSGKSSKELFLELQKILPNTVGKVLVLSPKLRFLSNIVHYWRHQFLWSDHVDKATRVAIGVSESLDNNLTNGRKGDTILASDWPAVVWMDLDLLRYQELTSNHVERKMAYLGQEWARPLNMTDDKMTIRAVVWPEHIEATESVTQSHILHFTPSHHLNPALQIIKRIQLLNPHSLRDPRPLVRSGCFVTPYSLEEESLSWYQGDECAPFRRATVLTYLTHLYYQPGDDRFTRFNQNHQQYGNAEFSVTLLTMFTVNRFDRLLLVLASWDGPMTAVLYASPEEVQQLFALLSQSEDNHRLRDITIHVVYRNGARKNEDLVPVNHLRNLAKRESTTNYVFYDDIDLIPIPGLYAMIQNNLRMEQAQGTLDNHVFIVPAFSTDLNSTLLSPIFPGSKQQLLAFVNNETITAWGQTKPGWKFGHRNTNYTKWMKTTQSYEVNYQHLWEPYMVVPRNSTAVYVESLTERIRNKIAYTLALYVEGFRFRILPDVFIVHQKHHMADNWREMRNDMKQYKRCCFQLYKEYVLKLSDAHPHVAMPNDTMFEISYGSALDESKLDW